MKRIQILIPAIAVLLFAFSCEKDGGTSVIPLDEGAAPNFVIASDSDQFIDLTDINNGQPISLSFKAEVAQGKPSQTDIVGVYTKVTGEVYYGTLLSDVDLPQDIVLDVEDIIAAFAEITGAADIDVGDTLSITARFTMPDGTVLNIISTDGITGGTGTNIATTVLLTTVINFPVSCPSDLGGTHSFVSTNLVAGNNPGACPSGSVSGTVTWTDLGGGTYQTSDLGFGQYESSCWNDTPATSGGATFTEICGEIFSGGADQYGLTYTWVITDVSGPTLTMTWSNNYADSGTVVITREGGADWPALFTQ